MLWRELIEHVRDIKRRLNNDSDSVETAVDSLCEVIEKLIEKCEEERKT